jgi:hypothetical protein
VETGIIPFQPSENEDMWYWLRRTRNKLLSASDWTQVPDCSLSDEKKEEWRVYRQQLRDFPATLTEDPGVTVEFPDPPA